MIPTKTDQIETMLTGMSRRTFTLAMGVSERRILLAVADIILINLALFVSLVPQDRVDFSDGNWARTASYFVFITAYWFVISAFFEVYELRYAASSIQSMVRTGVSALIISSTYYMIPFLPPPIPDRRLYFLVLILLCVTSVVVWRVTYATFFVQPLFQRTALVVGAGRTGRTLSHSLMTGGDSSLANMMIRLVGFIDDDPDLAGSRINGVPVLGTCHDLVDIYRRIQPDEIVLAISNSQHVRDDMFRALLDCRELGGSITMMATLYEHFTGRVPVEYAGRDLYVILPIEETIAQRLHGITQRFFDVVFGLVGSLGLLILIPIVWTANRFTDPGDLFYRQERVGHGSESFHVIKFRSMIMDAEKFTGAVWAEEDDPRITPVGRFLRKTRLDEVPQFWNVLKGEMSLIGPRPERPHFVDQLSQEIPYFRLRHAVKPGLTGWAQVNYRYGASSEDARIKLEYDLFYIKNRSFSLDLQIILKTVQVMLGFKGR